MGKFEDTISKTRELLGETGKVAEEVIQVQKLKLFLQIIPEQSSIIQRMFFAAIFTLVHVQRDFLKMQAEKKSSVLTKFLMHQ